MAGSEAQVSDSAQPVYAAIDRWVESGLIDHDTANKLRAEVATEASAGTRRLSQYVLASTGGLVLLIASGVFLDWAWPRMGMATRTFLLAAAGVALIVLGVSLEGKRRWLPAAYLTQTTGMTLILFAAAYSEEAWSDASFGGALAGTMALVTPIVLAPRAMRRNAVMPAVHFTFGLAFLALFLDRATTLSEDAIVWLLDAALALSILVLARTLVRDPTGERHPWVLHTFVMAMVAGFALVSLTAAGPLDMEEGTIWPLDAWLGMSVALAIWGVESGTAAQRDLLGRLLAVLIVVWIPMGFYTALGALDGSSELPLLVVGGGAVVGFVYANRASLRDLMIAAALAFLVPVWYWAVDRGGALGGVAALALTAALLFLMSGRMGPRETKGEHAG
jgi:hypothetical protein